MNLLRIPLRVDRKMRDYITRGRFVLRHGGPNQLGLFIKEEVIRNTWLQISRTRWPGPALVHCYACGWKGRRFMTHCGAGYVVYQATCPQCGAFPRHRGFSWLLDSEIEGNLSNLGSGRGWRLLFAPELSMYDLLSPLIQDLVGVDYYRINSLVSLTEDIQNLSLSDDSVDFLSCFHVIEHVPDDRQALRELRRVLHERGLAIVNVPITFGRWESIEFGRPNPMLNDHYFDYGEDFVERLVDAGFSGTGYRLSAVVPKEHFIRGALQDELIFCLFPASDFSKPTIVDHLGRDLVRHHRS